MDLYILFFLMVLGEAAGRAQTLANNSLKHFHGLHVTRVKVDEASGTKGPLRNVTGQTEPTNKEQ